MEDTAIVRLAAELAGSEEVADAVELMSAADVFANRAKEIKEMAAEAILEFVTRNGAFEWQGVKYYPGDIKKIKVRDKAVLAEKLLETYFGDWRGMAEEVLVAQPFKTGPCRKILGEYFEDHFVTEVVPKLKEGKPVKKLLKVPVNLLEDK